MKKRFTPAAVLILVLCASFAFSQPDQQEPNSEDRYGRQRFPARGGSVDWGLALSGGGPRSAYFSIGAMKALYDQGFLDRIDVISSTSGGSYATYWLFTRHTHGDQKFGAGVFDDNVFLKEICFLQDKKRANFIPFSLARKNYNEKPEKQFAFYEERINKSFGNDANPKMQDLNSSIKAGKIPYFIINTSIESRPSAGNSKPTKPWRVFEITPEYRGNYELGFREWQNTETLNIGTVEDSPLPISKAVAYAALPSRVTTYPMTFGGRDFDMWDGGETENLAALALIRRGVENVVIVDAVQDSHPFESYVTLQRMLNDLDISLCVEDIERFLKKPNSQCYPDSNRKKSAHEKKSVPVYKGKATSNDGGIRVKSNIYYIKMARPKEVLPEWFLDNDVLEAGRLLVKEREDQRCPKKTSCCFCEGIKLNLEDAAKRKAFYTNRVRKYDHFLRHIRPWNHPIIWLKLLPFRIAAKKNPFYDYNFPNITTLELTYTADQVEALVGLGYLQTMQLDEAIAK